MKLNLSEIQAVHGIHKIYRLGGSKVRVVAKNGLNFIGCINLTRKRSYVIVGKTLNIKDFDHATVGIIKSA